MKREIYKATHSGNEYLLSFTARRLMANLREAVAEHVNTLMSTAGENENHWTEVSKAREKLVAHISNLETELIDMKEAIKYHQRRSSIDNLSSVSLITELAKRYGLSCEQTTSNFSNPARSARTIDQVVAGPLKNFPPTSAVTPDTADNSSAPFASASGPCSQPATAAETSTSTTAPKQSLVITAIDQDNTSPKYQVQFSTTASPQTLDGIMSYLLNFQKNLSSGNFPST